MVAHRKTTITLPTHMLESLRIGAIRQRTTMSELICRAVEAYDYRADSRASAKTLEDFLHASEDVVRSWVVGEGDESDDFDDADID